MNKKTVCFFNTNKAWGGGEKWHFTTCQYFKEQGLNTFLITNVNSELYKKAEKSGLTAIASSVSNLSFLNPLQILKFVSLFKKLNVETVVMNLPADLKVAGIAARIAGVKNIIYRRGMPHPLRDTWLNRFLFQKVLTHVVVNSEEIGRSLSKANGDWFPTEKMVLVYNGVDTAIPLIPKTPIYTRQGDEIILGNAGRLVDQKGQSYLLEMVQKLKSERLNIRLLIAGEGDLRDELKELAAKLGVASNVVFLGHVDDMNAFMSSIDIFVFSSKFEGSANTLIETLYFQKPIVAFNVSSNPEIVIDGVTGKLAKAFDVNDLTNKVRELIQSKAEQQQYVANGVKLLNDRFDTRKNLQTLQRIINN